jgi:hypothetical protein
MKPSKEQKKDYQRYKNLCESDGIKPMDINKWLFMHTDKHEDMSRWNKSRTAPSLWEKMDKDVLYDSLLKGRVDPDIDYVSMSNRVEIKRKKNV